MVALHAEDGLKPVAELLELGARKQLVRTLGLLEADHVRRPMARQLRDEIEAKADRIDVPGDEAHDRGDKRVRLREKNPRKCEDLTYLASHCLSSVICSSAARKKSGASRGG